MAEQADNAGFLDSLGDLVVDFGQNYGNAWLYREFGQQPQQPPAQDSNLQPEPVSVNQAGQMQQQPVKTAGFGLPALLIGGALLYMVSKNA